MVIFALHNVDGVGVPGLVRCVGLAVVDKGVVEEHQRAGFHLAKFVGGSKAVYSCRY